jgi:hypothetical protein
MRRVKKIRNYEVGWAGERLVAERLTPLARHGYLIFHDCPAENHGNIDHIVVTPTEVYAIETKTRRKVPSPDPDPPKAEVIYDGQTLIFPHGDEGFGLDQARRQARWLSGLLSRHLAEHVSVQPVLGLPGWWVERRGRGDVSVLNPNQLPALICERKPIVWNSAAVRRMQQIEVVLDGLCRDVVFGRSEDPAHIDLREKAKPQSRPRSPHRQAPRPNTAARALDARRN